MKPTDKIEMKTTGLANGLFSIKTKLEKPQKRIIDQPISTKDFANEYLNSSVALLSAFLYKKSSNAKFKALSLDFK